MIRFFDSLVTGLTGRSDFSDQYRRYRETVGWIIRSLIRFDTPGTLVAVASNILGGLLKTAALAFLLFYANLMERGLDVTVLGYSWPSRSETVFYFAISTALLFLVAGALFVYGGNHVVNTLTIKFASHCSQRVLGSSGGRPHRNADPRTDRVPSRARSGVTGIIGLTRAVRPILQVSNPLATVLYSVIILFYMNAWLSLLIMLLVLPSLLLQYLVNYHSAQNEKAFMNSRVKAHRKLNRLLDDYSLMPRLGLSGRDRLVDEYSESVVGENLRHYYLRMMAQPKSALVSDILLAVLSFLVIAYLGSSALNGEIGWTLFVGYLVFARICLMGLRGVLVSITGFARHYPRARRVFEYLRFQDNPDVNGPVVIAPEARGRGRIGDQRKLTMEAGEPLMLLSPVPLSRFNLYAFIDVLVSGNIEQRNRLGAVAQCIPKGFSRPPDGSLQELLGVDGSISDDALADMLQSRGLAEFADPAYRKGPINTVLWRALPRHIRACMLLEQSNHESVQLTLVDAAVYNAARGKCRKRWRQVHTDSVIVLVTDTLSRLKHYEGEFVILMAPDRTVSIASKVWCGVHETEIHTWMQRHSVEESSNEDEELSDME